MKHLLILIFLGIMMTSCQQHILTGTLSITPSPTSGKVLVQTGIPTATIRPPRPTKTNTPIFVVDPTRTPKPTRTLTPTVNIYAPPTVSNSIPAVCPSVDDNPPRPDFLYNAEHLSSIWGSQLFDETVGYLNQYGPDPIILAFEDRGLIDRERYFLEDVTNDGVQDFGFGFVGFSIFGCVDGAYQLWLQTDSDGYLSPGYLHSISDKNHNNVPEILINTGTSTQGGRDYQLIEWNGKEFITLLNEFVNVNTDVYYEDIDKDGIQELVFYQGIPIRMTSSYLDYFPWRRVKDYYRWNGYYYLLYKHVYDPPTYLFQAVQDADDASYWGDYDKALSLYQQVIFSDTLKPWSPEWRAYEEEVLLSEYGSTPMPPPPADDPNERPNLAAYSRYRIMLLHVLRGYIPEAKIVYDTLQEKFPEDQPGHIYAMMAQVFWDKYQATQSMEESCSAVTNYAFSPKDQLLYYISSTYHGWQSGRYSLEDLCPFTDVAPGSNNFP